ncbi:MAG: helix-turn-helix domain-containing protein [Haloferacaceae archaeon]
MLSVTLDMRQPDCPLARTTADHDVTFVTPHWNFSPAADRWTLRVSASGADPGALEGALRALRDHDAMREFDLQAKRGDRASLRTVFEGTEAMHAVADNGGFVVAPFRDVDGRERWTLGFDDPAAADATLAALDRTHEFAVEDRTAEPFDVLHHGEAAAALLDGCRRLTAAERDAVATAHERGYFETPRETTLASLGDALGVSDAAVSKALRRAERKLLGPALEARRDLDEG